MNEIGMGICRVDVFNENAWARLDGMKPPAQSFQAYVPLFITKPIDIEAAPAVPFFRVAFEQDVPLTAQAIRLPVKVVDLIRTALKMHGPYEECTDISGYQRRLEAAKIWVAKQTFDGGGPLARFRGTTAALVRGVLERLIGSFSLTDEDAVAIAAGVWGAPTTDVVAQIAAVVRKGGTWPADLDGKNLDDEHRAAVASRKRSEAAHARNAAEAGKIVDVVVGDEGIEGFVERIGIIPRWKHLQQRGAFDNAEHAVRPPTVVQNGLCFWLRRQIPGESLPSVEGTVPPDTKLRMTKSQLASVPGCWSDVFVVRELRAAHGVIDRRALTVDELIGEGDARLDTITEAARPLLTPTMLAEGSPTRLHVVSSLVRGYLLRPEVAAALIEAALMVSDPSEPFPMHARRVRIAGTVNGTGMPLGGLDRTVPAPTLRGWTRAEIEEACVAAVSGDEFWSWTSPGSLLAGLKFDAKTAPKQDPWLPILARALHGRDGEKFRTDALCKIVGGSVDRRDDTSRIKKIMLGLGWKRAEFKDNGERFRAYVKEPASPTTTHAAPQPPPVPTFEPHWIPIRATPSSPADGRDANNSWEHPS
jgi:hypothetical protein